MEAKQMSGNYSQAEGLFPLSYRIGTSQPGAPTLILNLLAYTPEPVSYTHLTLPTNREV